MSHLPERGAILVTMILSKVTFSWGPIVPTPFEVRDSKFVWCVSHSKYVSPIRIVEIGELVLFLTHPHAFFRSMDIFVNLWFFVTPTILILGKKLFACFLLNLLCSTRWYLHFLKKLKNWETYITCKFPKCTWLQC